MKASCALVRARPASSQALDERESGFLLVLVCHTLFLQTRSDLFHRSSRRRDPCGLRHGSNEGDESPLLNDPYHSFPKVRERLVLLGPHLAVHFLIELRRHLCKREPLLKKRGWGEGIFLWKNQTLTLFFNLNSTQNEGGRLWTKAVIS